MRRVGGYIVLVLGWLLICGAAGWFGGTLVALFYWADLTRKSFLFQALATIVIGLLAGIALVKWAWSLLGTPGGSAKRRKVLGGVLLTLGLLGMAAVGARGVEYSSDAAKSIDVGARAGVAALGLVLLLVSVRQASTPTTKPSTGVSSSRSDASPRSFELTLPEPPSTNRPEEEPDDRLSTTGSVGPRARRSPILISALVLLAMAVAALTIYLVTKPDAEPAARASAPSNSASPAPSPPENSPSSSPVKDEIQTVVNGSFNAKKGYSRGERLIFGVLWQDLPDDECRVHTYAVVQPRGAFESDCRSWEQSGHDVLFFLVRFENRSDRAVSLRLPNFVLSSRDGRSFAPINVRSEAEYPTSFLPPRFQLPPGARWRGFVTFDGHVIGMVPDRLSYVDGNQTLIQLFKGKHAVEEPT
jgi:hypothetical protein